MDHTDGFGVSTVTENSTLQRSVRPGVVEEINAVLDGDGEYDESLRARLHMVGTSLEGTGLELIDALGGYAITNTTHLGVLAGAGRRRLKSICECTAGLSVADVAERFGFATTLDQVLDTAAYQVDNTDLGEAIVEKRLQYLYGAASADLGIDVDPQHFARGVASRVRRDEPERWSLPARVRAAEYKSGSGLDVGDAPRDVERILAVDPGFGSDRRDPPREPFLNHRSEPSAPVETVDPDAIDVWGCPFCRFTGSGRGVMDHVNDPEGPHAHRTHRHVPGYDDDGALRAVILANADEGDLPVRADAAPLERWTTPKQRDAARVGVPMETVHTASGVPTVLAGRDLAVAMDPESGDCADVATSTGDSSTGGPDEPGSNDSDWLSQS